jgi:C4-type Zn-finger protein
VEKELDDYPILCRKCGNHLFVFIANDPYKGRLTDYTIICKKCGNQYSTIAQIAKELEGSKDVEGLPKQ